MSWKPGIMPILDVVLRVPPLFIMDSVLNGTLGLPWLSSKSVVGLEELNEEITSVSYSYSQVTVFLLSLICFAVSILIFLLTTKQILEFYSYIFSGVVLWFSYWFNKNYVESELQVHYMQKEPIAVFRENPGPTIANIVVQVAMAFCYNSFHIDSQQKSDYIRTNSEALVELFRSLTYMCLLQPVIWRFIVLSPEWLRLLPSICVLLVGMELVFIAILQCRHLYFRTRLTISTIRVLVRTYGVQFFMESQWVRLHVPNVLRVFWIIRTVYHVINLSVGTAYENLGANHTFALDGSEVVDISRQALITGSETVLALLGMTSIISYITHYFGIFLARFVGSENEEDKTMGTVSAILFFILAQQTGLTGLHPDKRLQRLFRNFCLLSTAILHFIHSMVNPLLMNLSAGHNPNRWRHARPLFMCFLLISLPLTLMVYLWEKNTLSTWMLAVTAFSIEVIIKVVITLLLYGLFMYDTYRDPFWEKMDDYVYYIKSTGNTIEFLFGILLFCNGAWIMIFEHGGTIRACMMCIHAYFNIWVQAMQGWKVFMNRRTAVKKIESLPEASRQQLDEHNDVCAICYQDLNSARVTRCNHLFHGVCLRKWLYLQDRCPLCHQLIYKDAEQETEESPEAARNRQNNNNFAAAADEAAADEADDEARGENNVQPEIEGDAADEAEGGEGHAPRYYNSSLPARDESDNGTDQRTYQMRDPYGPHGGTSSENVTFNVDYLGHANQNGIRVSFNQRSFPSQPSSSSPSSTNMSHRTAITSNGLSHNTGQNSDQNLSLRSPRSGSHSLQGQSSDSSSVPNGGDAHLHRE